MALIPNTKVSNVDGDNMVVASGGTVTVKSGATLDCQFGSTANMPAGLLIGGIAPILVSGNAPVTVAAATTTLTLTPALHARRLVLVQSTGGLAITPPAATGTGNLYKVVCIAAITGGSLTIDLKAGAAADIGFGWVQTYKATTFTPYINVTNTNLITYNGTTTGGAAIGDWVEIQDVGTNKWLISGFGTQSGTIATPLSNH